MYQLFFVHSVLLDRQWWYFNTFSQKKFIILYFFFAFLCTLFSFDNHQALYLLSSAGNKLLILMEMLIFWYIPQSAPMFIAYLLKFTVYIPVDCWQPKMMLIIDWWIYVLEMRLRNVITLRSNSLFAFYFPMITYAFESWKKV
jgi:hypothetical protein